ncbi:MAG: N-acetyl-gamma-glutamyl-phosphate reductase [Bacteroidia bacterium]
MKIKAGIAGAAGYTGGELIRILLAHPRVELVSAMSKSAAGQKYYTVHADMLGRSEACFDAQLAEDIDVLFLCLGHGESRNFLEKYPQPGSRCIIDLSTDFRHKAQNAFANRNFIYGLPEINRAGLRGAKSIANPGCFATAIQLALLPLTQNKDLNKEVHIQALTGSTGAGQSLSAGTHFTWRHNNVSVYKAFTHQHLTEITENLKALNGTEPTLHFIPQRGGFTRGIFASIQMECSLDPDELMELYQNYYKEHPFTRIAPFEVDMKQVVNTNFCYLQLIRQGDQLVLISVIDNLLKGASGQAVQNMNLAFGLEETMGLQLKATAF